MTVPAGWFRLPGRPGEVGYWTGERWDEATFRRESAPVDGQPVRDGRSSAPLPGEAAPVGGDSAPAVREPVPDDGGSAPLLDEPAPVDRGSAPQDPGVATGLEMVDLHRYVDLTARLAAFSTDGGAHLAGDAEDLRIVDGDVALRPGEQEQTRVAGVVELIGSRSTSESREPSLGLVMHGAGTLVVTDERIIVMLLKGVSQLGTVDNDDRVHTLVLPWDLVDTLSIPVKRRMQDRIAGSRTIMITSITTFTTLNLVPANRAQVAGLERKVRDDDVMDLLVHAGVTARLARSPSSDHGRLHEVLGGRHEIDDGERVVWLSPAGESDELPPHLVGRLVERRVPGQ